MNKVNVKILAMGIAFCLPAVLLAIFGKLEILVMGFMLIYGVLSGGLFYLVCILIGDWKERNSTVVMLDKRLGEVMKDNTELRKNLQEAHTRLHAEVQMNQNQVHYYDKLIRRIVYSTFDVDKFRSEGTINS